MTRQSWGGPGLSVLLHAVLLTILISLAAQQPRAKDDIAPLAPARLVYIVRPGPEGAGSEGRGTKLPRPARAPEIRPVEIAAPHSITNVEPPPMVAVPVMAALDVDILPGSPMAVDGSAVGRGSGPGVSEGRGPGSGRGPGEGPGESDVYTAGVGGVGNPTLVHEVRPNYTVDAMRAKIQGVVIMEVVVLANGTVDPQSIRVTRSLGFGLEAEAVLAVRQWRFRPSTRLGRPVNARVIVELGFILR